MKSKIRVYIQLIYQLGGVLFIGWLVLLGASGIISFFKPHKLRYPRIEGLTKEAIKYKDSIYVFSKKLDTVYHVDNETGPNENRF